MDHSLLFLTGRCGLGHLSHALRLAALSDTFPALSAWSRPMPRRVLPLKPSDHTLQTAAAAFLDRPDLSPASRPSYTQTLQRLTHVIGGERPLGALESAAVGRAVEQAWGGCAPATWNRHVATVR